MKIGIIGTGYVGLPTGVGLADLGHQVVCVDKIKAKIDSLNAGQLTIYEDGLAEMFAKNKAAGRLSFTCSMQQAVSGADIVIIAVGTPPHPVTHEADLQYIYAAAAELAEHLTNYTVVATKSTVPVGTGDKVEEIIRTHNPAAQFDVISLPEFLREGFALHDFFHPDRIVIGTNSPQAAAVMQKLYQPFADKTKILQVSRRSSETIKYASNAFLAMKIHYINEMADFCEKAGADPRKVYDAIRGGLAGSTVLDAKIPYAIWGGTRFFERKEVKDALSYLRLVNDTGDDLSFERIVNVPSRKIGKKFLDGLKERAGREGLPLFAVLKACVAEGGAVRTGAEDFVRMIEEACAAVPESTVSDLLNFLLERSGLKRALREDQDEERLENVDELLRSVRFYETSHGEDDVRLSDYLQDIALYTNQDYRKDTPTVKLMTVHQAKGLEFPYVFVIGLSEGVFPSMRTIREYKKNGEEEERRLMYVAVTRAQRALFLTESEGYNVSTKMSKYPSRFLAEIRRDMFVTEGVMPESLWRGTENMRHVLDEERWGSRVEASEGDPFATERAAYFSPFQAGDTVVHDIFGTGTVVGVNKEGSTFQVRFADGSTRHLRADFLRREDLPE